MPRFPWKTSRPMSDRASTSTCSVKDSEVHTHVTNERPMAVADGAFDPENIALEFEGIGAMVPPTIYRFVLSVLHSRP